MSLIDGQSKLTQEDMINYKIIFGFEESDPKNYEESESLNNKDNQNDKKDENRNKSENSNINGAKEEIIINNENDNKLETSLVEKNLSNSGTKNYILVQSNNIKKKLFITQPINESNSITKNNLSLKKKRGRTKKSDDQREHSKFSKDNIELKINGIFNNSIISFINKKIDDQSKKLKTLSFKETKNFKLNMNKKVQDICQKVSKRYGKDYNKNLISAYEPNLKEIFEMPMYKVAHHIFGKYVDILMGLEEEYSSLKNKKLEKESDDYKKMFNEIESKFLNLTIAKYPIIDENTKEDTLNLKNNVDKNYLNFDNGEMIGEFQPFFRQNDIFINNINDFDLSIIISSNFSNIDMDEILSFSEC